MPRAVSGEEIEELKQDWRAATRRALAAGFEVVEVHGAHGYLLHQFLSAMSNRRDDAYGGDLQGRMRLPLEIAEIVLEEWPAGKTGRESSAGRTMRSGGDWPRGALQPELACARRYRTGGGHRLRLLARSIRLVARLSGPHCTVERSGIGKRRRPSGDAHPNPVQRNPRRPGNSGDHWPLARLVA